MKSNRNKDRKNDKRLVLEALREAGGELNAYELRHQHLHWMSTTQINSIGKALMADGLVTCEVVPALHAPKGVTKFTQPKVTVWRLVNRNKAIAT